MQQAHSLFLLHGTDFDSVREVVHCGLNSSFEPDLSFEDLDIVGALRIAEVCLDDILV